MSRNEVFTGISEGSSYNLFYHSVPDISSWVTAGVSG